MTGETEPDEEPQEEQVEPQEENEETTSRAVEDLSKEELLQVVYAQQNAMENVQSPSNGPSYFELDAKKGLLKLQAPDTPLRDVTLIAETFMKNTGVFSGVSPSERTDYI